MARTSHAFVANPQLTLARTFVMTSLREDSGRWFRCTREGGDAIEAPLDHTLKRNSTTSPSAMT